MDIKENDLSFRTLLLCLVERARNNWNPIE